MPRATTRKNRFTVRTADNEKSAVIYLRMSSNPQKDSIEQQRKECLLYAADNGYSIVGEYVDEGISGVASYSKRKGFSDLIVDIETGDFQYVICWKQSRASRSKPCEFFAEMNPIVQAGGILVFTDKGERDLRRFEDFLTAAIEANTNNEFIESMASDVIRGQRAKAMMGLWVAGTMPFGLTKTVLRDDLGNPVIGKNSQPVTGVIVPGEDRDVETVQLIFDWYVEGLSISGIVERLRTERGEKRTDHFVQKILANPLYVGDYRWNHCSSARFAAVRDGRITNEFKPGKTSEADQVFIENNHEPIISREVWNKVQALRLERRIKTTPFRNGGQHLLTGLCRCMRCGNRMSGHTYKKDQRRCVTCNGKKHGTCVRNMVRQDQIIACLVTTLEEWLTEDRIAKLRQKLTAKLKRARTTIDAKGIKTRIGELQKQCDATRADWSSIPAECREDFAADMRRLKTEIDELTTQLEQASKPPESVVESFDTQVETLIKSLGSLKIAIETVAAEKPHLIRELISSFVQEIRLDVKDLGEGRNPRYKLVGGELQLKPAFNLVPAS